MSLPKQVGRTRRPAPEIRTVAAVVTGGQRLRLTGWMRDEAVAAMTALGYSASHIAWALCGTESGVQSTAQRMGLKAHAQDQRVDWLTVWMLCKDPKLRLVVSKPDRVDAIRALALRRRTAGQIAYQTGINVDTVTTIAYRNNIEIMHPQRGWAELLEFSRRNPDSQLSHLVAI